jgi:D-glycero-D-manno-heptose 1,7-bisphosphate phosphatase
MFLQAAKDLGLDLAQSWSVGDKPSDMEAAKAAGVGMRVLFGRNALEDAETISFQQMGSLAEISELLTRDPPPAEN